MNAFRPYGIFFEYLRYYDLYHGNAVKRFWAFWYSIYEYDCLLL
jgi:hypothetical protein